MPAGIGYGMTQGGPLGTMDPNAIDIDRKNPDPGFDASSRMSGTTPTAQTTTDGTGVGSDPTQFIAELTLQKIRRILIRDKEVGSGSILIEVISSVHKLSVRICASNRTEHSFEHAPAPPLE